MHLHHGSMNHNVTMMGQRGIFFCISLRFRAFWVNWDTHFFFLKIFVNAKRAWSKREERKVRSPRKQSDWECECKAVSPKTKETKDRECERKARGSARRASVKRRKLPRNSSTIEKLTDSFVSYGYIFLWDQNGQFLTFLNYYQFTCMVPAI